MTRVSTSEPLAVLLSGQVVAQVHQPRPRAYRLEYEPSVRNADTTPLSLSLPPTTGVFNGAAVETYLWGLLPEDVRAREAVRRTHPGTDPNDALSLLAAIGKECAGAVQFCVLGEVDDVLEDSGWLEPASPVNLEVRLSGLRMNPEAGWLLPDEHWSLAGTQAKFGVRRQADKWYWAHGAQATTHIVKPGVSTLRAQVLVEHLTMAAARHLGLLAAPTEFLDFHSERALVVERFDREVSDGGAVTRVHQEDLSQAMGVSQKYEEFGGPSPEAIIDLLRTSAATARQGRDNVDAFVDALVFNTIVAATDAHARNHAVILDRDQVRFAPLHDVATSLAYERRATQSRRLSMQIDGIFDAAMVDDKAWVEFARANRLDDGRVMSQVRHVRDGAAGAFEAALLEVEADDWDQQVSGVAQRLLPNLAAHLGG